MENVPTLSPLARSGFGVTRDRAAMPETGEVRLECTRGAGVGGEGVGFILFIQKSLDLPKETRKILLPMFCDVLRRLRGKWLDNITLLHPVANL